MHPHQLPLRPDGDEPVYDSYPVLVASPRLEIAPQPRWTDQNSYPDAYPQPCLQEYPHYPPQLHIQTDLSLRYHDPHSPFASASTATSYPPPTPPSAEPRPGPSEHTDCVYASPDSHMSYRVSHPDAPGAASLWHHSHPADAPQQPYPDSEQLDTRQVCPQWSPPYHVHHQSPPFTPPALAYYQDPPVHSQPDAQLAVSNMYSEEAPYSHPPQYISSPLSQSVYPPDQHQGAFPSQNNMMHQSPPSLSHASNSFHHPSHVQLSPEQAPPVNLELRHHAPFAPQALPPSDGIFDSPLRESIEEAPEYPEFQYRSPLPGAAVEQGFTHGRHVETGFQEHPPPPALYSETGSSWVSRSPADYQHPGCMQPVLDQHERHPSPHSLLALHPPPPLSPPLQQPGLPHVHMEPPFQGTLRQSPLHEGRLSRVHSPTRETGRGSIQGPIQPPQLLEPDPIPRLSQPCRSSRTPSASSPGAGPSAQAPYSDPPQTSHRRSPSSRPHGAQTDEQLLQAPVVPSQSHLAMRRERTNRANRIQSQAFRPFHPYPSHQRGDPTNPRVHYSEGTFLAGSGAGGICMPPTPVFGLFGSYPLSRGPREQPLPGPTCAPESSSSVMRLVLTPPFKRPPPPPPPPPILPTRRPRMACFFCRKRKIACGPGPPLPSRSTQNGKDDEKKEEDPPCNQCARRGLECDRPTESKRGVRRSKGRGKEGEEDEHASGTGSPRVTLELTPRPRPGSASTAPTDEGSSEGGALEDDGSDSDDDNAAEDPTGDGADSRRISEEK